MSNSSPPHRLAAMVAKLEQWRTFDSADRQAALDLPYRVIKLRPQEYIVREGDTTLNSCLMLSGYSFRNKVAGNGGRQVFSIHMRRLYTLQIHPNDAGERVRDLDSRPQKKVKLSRESRLVRRPGSWATCRVASSGGGVWLSISSMPWTLTVTWVFPI